MTDDATYRRAVERGNELERECERLRADAERYRWLRDPDRIVNEDDLVVCDGYNYAFFIDELDAAIDAARKVKP